MTRDEIAQMMQDTSGTAWGTEAHFQRFAALVAAHEREACAKDCETLLPSQRIFDHRYYGAVGDCVATIRARGEA